MSSGTGPSGCVLDQTGQLLAVRRKDDAARCLDDDERDDRRDDPPVREREGVVGVRARGAQARSRDPAAAAPCIGNSGSIRCITRAPRPQLLTRSGRAATTLMAVCMTPAIANATITTVMCRNRTTPNNVTCIWIPLPVQA